MLLQTLAVCPVPVILIFSHSFEIYFDRIYCARLMISAGYLVLLIIEYLPWVAFPGRIILVDFMTEAKKPPKLQNS